MLKMRIKRISESAQEPLVNGFCSFSKHYREIESEW